MSELPSPGAAPTPPASPAFLASSPSLAAGAPDRALSPRSPDAECLEYAEALCEPRYSLTPESGLGVLPAQNRAEELFNRLTHALPVAASALVLLIAGFITVDSVGRFAFNAPLVGITDLEILIMSAVGFLSIPVTIVQRQSMQIDLFYVHFSGKIQRLLYLFACLISAGASGVLAWRAALAAMHWTRQTGILELMEWPSLLLTGICLGLAGAAFAFQVGHALKSLWVRRELTSIASAVALAILLFALPFAYRMTGIRLSGLVIGGVGFLVLFSLLLLRVPLGFAMSVIGIVGLLAISRRPEAALNAVASIPFMQTATFIMIAFPMFMLMGEMVTLAGLSDDLFDAAKKWMGRLPGGLAVATVGGCAGFGAVCGDSMATVITMTSVALPAMRESRYDLALSTGTLAAGGTLGILIPPSIGFIMYSMITEESVGKLFVAGILPGLALSAIFMTIIMFQVRRHPDWAPKSRVYSLADKMKALLKLAPVVVLFLVVVMGILYGWFTPAEGGALGSVMAFAYALARRRLTWAAFTATMIRCTSMFGKLFALFVGLYVLGAFLTASRLPNLLAETVSGLEVNRYLILLAVIVLYIFLGCVMNIIPMMMLTLPSIFPTIRALGFDGVWFGVICVIVMEMGQITPPVGINVFTLAGLQPDISMGTIFRGVMPFFVGMLVCVALVVLFPQLALVLVP